MPRKSTKLPYRFPPPAQSRPRDIAQLATAFVIDPHATIHELAILIELSAAGGLAEWVPARVVDLAALTHCGYDQARRCLARLQARGWLLRWADAEIDGQHVPNAYTVILPAWAREPQSVAC